MLTNIIGFITFEIPVNNFDMMLNFKMILGGFGCSTYLKLIHTKVLRTHALLNPLYLSTMSNPSLPLPSTACSTSFRSVFSDLKF